LEARHRHDQQNDRQCNRIRLEQRAARHNNPGMSVIS
jgi:hypothetical protein